MHSSLSLLFACVHKLSIIYPVHAQRAVLAPPTEAMSNWYGCGNGWTRRASARYPEKNADWELVERKKRPKWHPDMVTAKAYVACGRSTCKCWFPLADLCQTVCKCGRRFPKYVLLAASLAGAEVEGFTAEDEADAEWAAGFLKRSGRKAESNKEFRGRQLSTGFVSFEIIFFSNENLLNSLLNKH